MLADFPVASMRRTPVQERSAVRVERMLDVCAELLAEVGYEAVTTKEIAARAGVSIGSLYQFFPDKRSLVRALVGRWLVQYVERIDAALAVGSVARWSDAVDPVIDAYVAMMREVTGFRALEFGDIVDRFLLDAERDNDTVTAGVVWETVGRYAEIPDGPHAERAALVAVTIGDSLIKLAFRRDPDGDPEIIAEAKAVVRAYLERRLGVG